MYKAKLWDEDKWNIHSSGYNSSKYGGNIFSEGKGKEESKYHEQKYGSEEKSLSSDYMKKEERDSLDEKKKDSMFEELEDDKKKNEKINDDDIPFKAAKQIFNEGRYEIRKENKKKETESIEDAIKKAIEEEKKVIVMDR